MFACVYLNRVAGWCWGNASFVFEQEDRQGQIAALEIHPPLCFRLICLFQSFFQIALHLYLLCLTTAHFNCRNSEKKRKENKTKQNTLPLQRKPIIDDICNIPYAINKKLSISKQIPGLLAGTNPHLHHHQKVFVPVQSCGLKADGKTAGSCGGTINTFLHSSHTHQSLKAKPAHVGIPPAPPWRHREVHRCIPAELLMSE